MELRVTKGQIEEFKQSFLWKDMKRELGMWIQGLKSDAIRLAAHCASEDIPNNISARLAAIGGRLEAIDYLLNLPDEFLRELEGQANARHKQTD